jgi:hypothetical protein
MADVPSTPPLEFGISGVTRFGSVSRVYEEFLQELQGPTGMKLYREQIDNCPITGAFLFAAQHLSRGATFRIDPARGTGVDDQQALAVAERVRGALFDDLDVTWPDLLSEILSMFGFGWAVHEIAFKRCHGPSPENEYTFTTAPESGSSGQGPEPMAAAPSKYNDGWLAFRSLGLRAQETLFMWEWDSQSNARVMQQMAPPDYKVRRIPLSKCLHFRTMLNKNNPEGRSLIRNAVPSYLFKKNIQAIEAIGIERDLAGYPVFQVKDPDPAKGLMPPDLWNKKDADAAYLLGTLKTMVKSVRRDEQEGMVLPWWVTFSLVSTGSRRQFDTNAIIQRYEKTIAMSVLADFIMLGHDSVGSKALASTKSQLFTEALNGLLDSVCAVFNRFAIPMLCRLNGVPAPLTPTIGHSSVETLPADVLGTFIARLAQAGAVLFPSADLTEALLDAVHMPTTEITDPNAHLTEGPQSGISPEGGGLADPTHRARVVPNRGTTAAGPQRLPRMRQTPGPRQPGAATADQLAGTVDRPSAGDPGPADGSAAQKPRVPTVPTLPKDNIS